MTSEHSMIRSRCRPSRERKTLGLGILILSGSALLTSAGDAEASIANISNGVCVTSDAAPTSTTLWSCELRTSNGGVATVTNVTSTATGTPNEAALSASPSTKLGPKALLVGDTNSAASELNSIAIGNNTRVTAAGAVNDTSGVAGQRSIAIGLEASTTMANSIAMGYGAIVQNTAASSSTPASAIAIGTGAAAMGNRSIAIGSRSGSTNSNGFDNVVVGITSGQNIQPVAAANHRLGRRARRPAPQPAPR